MQLCRAAFSLLCVILLDVAGVILLDVALAGWAILCCSSAASPPACRQTLRLLPNVPTAGPSLELLHTLPTAKAHRPCSTAAHQTPLIASRWCSSVCLLHQSSFERQSSGQILLLDLEKMTPTMDWCWGSHDLSTGNVSTSRMPGR
jgi:hypothetical protein